MKQIWQKIVQIDLWLEQYRLPIILLSLVVLLRIPTFFEPYWYGDEGIYLVLGEALNRGQILYAEIIDHKTPLIYVFAQVGNQLNFRLLMLLWLVGATALLIKISKQFFRHTASWLLTVLTFIAVISIPSFEGTIPNGELFVIGFVLAGVYCIMQSSVWRKQSAPSINRSDTALYLFAGLSFGLAILTKVPAVLDLGAWLILVTLTQFPSPRTVIQKFSKRFIGTAATVVILLLGVAVPILLSILYFILKGEAQAYLDYGLLYNFRYAGTWQPSFPHPIFSSIFSLPGKTIILGIAILTTWIANTKVPRYWTVALVWFWTTLFASLLSNRPYPHYFLQLLPPVALLMGSTYELLANRLQKIAYALTTVTLIPILVALIGVVLLLAVRPYPTISYYQNWWKYVSHDQTLDAYNQWFNPLMRDNYAAAKLLRTQGNGELFIWGTNPMLYALSDTIPTGRFTVSFHIHDFSAYDETMTDLVHANPPFIVIMNDEQGELPGLNQLLFEKYRLYRIFENYQLWKRNAAE